MTRALDDAPLRRETSQGLAAADGFEIVTGSAYLVRRKRESRNRGEPTTRFKKRERQRHDTILTHQSCALHLMVDVSEPTRDALSRRGDS